MKGILNYQKLTAPVMDKTTGSATNKVSTIKRTK